MADKPRCFTCNAEIAFDPAKRSTKTQKMIPLDPQTKENHQCRAEDIAAFEARKQEVQDVAPPVTTGQTTLSDKNRMAVNGHSQTRLKIFTHHDPAVMEGLYNSYINKVRALGVTEKGSPSSAFLNMGGGTQYVIFAYFVVPNDKVEEVDRIQT